MCVICLPSGKEHGQTRDEGSESACASSSVSYGCQLEQAAKRAIERVNAVTITLLAIVPYKTARGPLHVLKELSKATRSAGSSCLLAVHVIQCRVPAIAIDESIFSYDSA